MSHFILKSEELFSKNWFIVSVLVSFLLFQLIYSFLFPSVGFHENWQPISAYLPKFQVESSDNFLLNKIYPLISFEYRLNSDSGHYLELGRYFSPEYFEGNPFLERPLYPFLIFLPSVFTNLFIADSYGLIFVLAILVNFALISTGVLLFFLLLQKIFSLKVAWLSSVLLIFSPFVHSFINQPLAEMLMVFIAIASAFLIYSYIKKSSFLKLAVFSLLIGIFMLGKMFFAISFFILLLALYFRRLKEGAAFLVIHLLPILFWYLWVTKIWNIGYNAHQIKDWDMGVWVLDMVFWPWQKVYQTLLGTVPNFIEALVYSFLLIPIIFFIIGFQKLPCKYKNILYFASLFSVFLLGFLAKEFYFRHIFLLFPIIYPTAVLGMEKTAGCLKQYAGWFSPIFYVIVIGFTIFISNINIYRVFEYNS